MHGPTNRDSNWQVVRWARRARAWVRGQPRVLGFLMLLGLWDWLILVAGRQPLSGGTFLLDEPPRWLGGWMEALLLTSGFCGMTALVLSFLGLCWLWARREGLPDRWRWVRWLWTAGWILSLQQAPADLTGWRLLHAPGDELGVWLLAIASALLRFPLVPFLWLWVARRWRGQASSDDSSGMETVLFVWGVGLALTVLLMTLVLLALLCKGIAPLAAACMLLALPLMAALIAWQWVSPWLILLAGSGGLSTRRAWEALTHTPLARLVLPLLAAAAVCLGTVAVLGGVIALGIASGAPLLERLARLAAGFWAVVLFVPVYMLWKPALLLEAARERD